ncbi:MAG TPA: hypothetical protein GXZ93_05805 [Actinobacteria bacterium]|nr:hypothetical protein [Actinomycetota bacterium]
MKKFEVIGKWIKHGSKVLVLGCGEGELINYLQKKSDARVFGLDIDEKRFLRLFQKDCP